MTPTTTPDDRGCRCHVTIRVPHGGLGVALIVTDGTTGHYVIDSVSAQTWHDMQQPPRPDAIASAEWMTAEDVQRVVSHEHHRRLFERLHQSTIGQMARAMVARLLKAS